MALALKSDPIWKEANAIAEYMYGKLAEFPDEEKWDSEQRLRTSALDLIFTVAQGVGNANPYGREYDWGQARKHAFSLQTIYRFASRQRFIELDPEMMIRLDKLIDKIDEQSEASIKGAKAENDKELGLWQEKYKLWSQMNGS